MCEFYKILIRSHFYLISHIDFPSGWGVCVVQDIFTKFWLRSKLSISFNGAPLILKSDIVKEFRMDKRVTSRHL